MHCLLDDAAPGAGEPALNAALPVAGDSAWPPRNLHRQREANHIMWRCLRSVTVPSIISACWIDVAKVFSIKTDPPKPTPTSAAALAAALALEALLDPFFMLQPSKECPSWQQLQVQHGDASPDCVIIRHASPRNPWRCSQSGKTDSAFRQFLAKWIQIVIIIVCFGACGRRSAGQLRRRQLDLVLCSSASHSSL